MNTYTLTQQKLFKLGATNIQSMRFGSGTNCIHLLSRGSQVTIFDPNKNFLRRNYRLDVQAPVCSDWSREGHHLAIGTWRGVEIFDSSTGQLITKTPQHISIISKVAWSPGREYIAIAARSIRIWDTASESYEIELHGHKYGVGALAWNDDSTLLASADERGHLIVWDIQGARKLVEQYIDSPLISSLAWSRESTFLAIPTKKSTLDGGAGIDIQILDFKNGKIVANLDQTNGYIRSMTFNMWGNLLIAKDSSSVHIWSCDTWERIAHFPETGSNYIVSPLDLNVGGSKLATLDNNDTDIRVWGFPQISPSDTAYKMDIETSSSQTIDLTGLSAEPTELILSPAQQLQSLFNTVEEAKTSNEKGKSLEILCKKLFESISGLEVETNYNTTTEEIDIVVRNMSPENGWLGRQSFYILGECKNWSSKTGKNEYVLFKEKIKNRRGQSNLGFLISWNGFSNTTDLESLRSSNDDIVVALLTKEDLYDAIQTGDFVRVLMKSHEHAVLK